jgi:pimeloyl-ACP methyl ester carboxylesterase
MACHVKRNVSGGPSYAFVSDSNSVDTAIVYVHGFLGHAQSTWEQLQYYVDRLDNEPFRDVDLFFYDYPAEDNFVHLSVPSLRAFLNQIFPLPPPELLEVHFRDLDWRLTDDPEVITLREHRPYSRLVLVGHSLGAVVIRRLIADEALTAHANRTTPSGLEAERLLDSELVLMAPAHLGFQPTGRTALFQILPFSAFVLRSAFLFRAFSDLQQGCHFLTQLQRETERMAGCFPKSPAFQPRILWGDTEGIVTVGRFDSDSPNAMRYAEGKDHVTVCKLTRAYLTPAEIVLRRDLAHGA